MKRRDFYFVFLGMAGAAFVSAWLAATPMLRQTHLLAGIFCLLAVLVSVNTPPPRKP